MLAACYATGILPTFTRDLILEVLRDLQANVRRNIRFLPV